MHDPRCYELAEYFLADEHDLQTEKAKSELAQNIQDSVEEWLASARDHSDV